MSTSKAETTDWTDPMTKLPILIILFTPSMSLLVFFLCSSRRRKTSQGGKRQGHKLIPLSHNLSPIVQFLEMLDQRELYSLWIQGLTSPYHRGQDTSLDNSLVSSFQFWRYDFFLLKIWVYLQVSDNELNIYSTNKCSIKCHKTGSLVKYESHPRIGHWIF